MKPSSATLAPLALTVALVGYLLSGLGGTPAADTKRIMAAIVDCLPPEAREQRTPTAEEIALATPRGR